MIDQKTADEISKGILLIGGGGILLLIAMIVFISMKSEPQPEPQISAWHSEHCLIGEYPIGHTLTLHESNAGMYSYTLIPRTDGIVEIWKDRPCDEEHASGGTL